MFEKVTVSLSLRKLGVVRFGQFLFWLLFCFLVLVLYLIFFIYFDIVCVVLYL